MVTTQVTGLAMGLSRARARFEEIASEEEESIDADPGLINFLLSRGATAMKQLEADTGVRAKAMRDTGKVWGTSVRGSV